MITKITKLPGSAVGDASLVRPKFSSGLLLQDDDLTHSIDYLRNMTRLLFKSMLGCGVLCGLKVTARIVCTDHLQIEVEKGVALDCQGDLIELLNQEFIEYAPSCVNGKPGELPDEVWVVICHKERDCSPRDVLCSSEDGDVAPVYTRTREGYQLKVISGQEKSSGCCECKSTEENKLAKATREAEAAKTQGRCCDYIAIPADPLDDNDCYAKHYNGDCACDCGCDCITLARIDLTNEPDKSGEFAVDHSVRRFIRPVLMKDPLLKELLRGSVDNKDVVVAKQQTAKLSNDKINTKK